MIPKKLHYVWFGGNTKPDHVQETVNSWQRVMPDYEIFEWNETNFDITQHPWMEEMHRTGKYAFASDWARLHVLQMHGGIYLDTDVEIHKSFDRFLDSEMFWGFEYDCYLATCIIASKPYHPSLTGLLAEYDSLSKAVINNSIVTKFFLREYPEFKLDNSDQELSGGIKVFGKEYFSVPCFEGHKNYCRHHGSNLWKENRKNACLAKKIIRSALGEVLYYKLAARKVLMTNEFYPIYKLHKSGKSL